MNLRHLRTYVAVAEARSFTRAARRLHLAQPAVSVQIRKLESELAVELVDRSRRSIALTDAGALLLVEGRRLLAQAEHTADLVRRSAAGAIGRVSIGFVPSASNTALPVLLRAFSESHPDAVLDLREQAPDELVRGLREHALDVAFLYMPFEDPLLEHSVVSREAFVAALPGNHALARHRRLDVAALRDEPFILPARHSMPGLHAHVLDICREAGFAPYVVQDDVWLVQTIVGLVAAGVGVALVPAGTKALQRRGVAYRPLCGRSLHEVELAAVWRGDERSAVVRAFVTDVAGP